MAKILAQSVIAESDPPMLTIPRKNEKEPSKRFRKESIAAKSAAKESCKKYCHTSLPCHEPRMLINQDS